MIRASKLIHYSLKIKKYAQKIFKYSTVFLLFTYISLQLHRYTHIDIYRHIDRNADIQTKVL